MVAQAMRSPVFLAVIIAAVVLRAAHGTHVSNHVHRTKKLYDSEYFSLHKMKSLPPVDLSNPESYDTLIDSRVYKNEVIIASFTTLVIRWLLHWTRMAQALGFDHFLVLGLDEDSCGVFKEHWCDGVDDSEGQCTALYPGCGWIGKTDLVDKKVEQIWLDRIHVAAELIRRGVNPFLSDLDVVFHGDFYKLLKAPPVDKYHFVQMPGDEYPNGGLWYVQNAHPQGPVQKFLQESVKMAEEIMALRVLHPTFDMTSAGHHCSYVDQDVMKYALTTAVLNRSRAEWMCVPKGMDTREEWKAAFGEGYGPHPVTWQLSDGAKHPPWRKLVDPEGVKGMGEGQLASLPFLVPPHAAAGEACMGEAECGRMATLHRHRATFWPALDMAIFQYPDPRPDTQAVPARVQPLPPSPASELILTAPQYLFNDATMMLRGWGTPRPAPWAMVTHLVAFGFTWGNRTGGRNNRVHVIQAHGQWHAPEPTPERLVRITQSAARAAAGQATDGPFRQLVHALMVAAAVTGRTPVLPAVPCSAAPWMHREEQAMHGFYDPHFITYLRDLKEPAEGDNVMCAPYLSFRDDCTDQVVLSEFHLDQDLLYSSYKSESLTLQGVDGGGWAAEVAELRAAAEPHGDARVLFVGGDVAAVTALGKGHVDGATLGAGRAGGGEPAEGDQLARLQSHCPDFFEHEPLANVETHPV